jgi:type I restriction enzyme, R subunit
VNAALIGADDGDEDETVEDKINAIMERAERCSPMRAISPSPRHRKTRPSKYSASLLPRATRSSIVPFHSYTMKQAIEEGFIVDVLRYYTPVNSYYRLVKTVEADPEFDVKRYQEAAPLYGEQ